MAARGRCGGCGASSGITKRGLVWAHESAEGGRERGIWPQWARCPGVGMPPIGEDEPLVAAELRDLRAEVAELRRENESLRLIASAERHRYEAARAQARGLEHLREIARIAFDAMCASDEERAARFAAQMDALHAEHPVLREGNRV